MPKYIYQAINDKGETISGAIEADTPEMAENLLAHRGDIPVSVKAESLAAGGGGLMDRLDSLTTSVKATDLILYIKQFRTMMKAGISIIMLLQTLETQTENKKLQMITRAIAEDIKGGSSLHDAFRKHPGIFVRLYCSMIQAGEASGTLPQVLERLTYIIEHEHKIKSDIKAALQYPLIVLVFLTIAFFVLLTFVIPKFIKIFQNAGLELPLPTKICMYLYNFMSSYWLLIIMAVAGTVIPLYLYFKTEQGKLVRDTFLLKVPIIGPLFLKAAMSRFSSIFAILQASGVGVLQSISILSGTIGNAAIANQFDKIKERLEGGRGITGPLKSAKYFPPLVINMVAIGEESGNLDEMLQEVSHHYDEEVNYAVKKLSDAIGPLLAVGLSAMVGFFALAIFLPMWDLTKVVK